MRYRVGSWPESWYILDMSADELLSQAMALPTEQRAKLAQTLLRSLDDFSGDPDEMATTWVPELVRRSQEVVDGKVELVDWEEVRLNALARCRDGQ